MIVAMAKKTGVFKNIFIGEHIKYMRHHNVYNNLNEIILRIRVSQVLSSWPISRKLRLNLISLSYFKFEFSLNHWVTVLVSMIIV